MFQLTSKPVGPPRLRLEGVLLHLQTTAAMHAEENQRTRNYADVRVAEIPSIYGRLGPDGPTASRLVDLCLCVWCGGVKRFSGVINNILF